MLGEVLIGGAAIIKVPHNRCYMEEERKKKLAEELNKLSKCLELKNLIIVRNSGWSVYAKNTTGPEKFFYVGRQKVYCRQVVCGEGKNLDAYKKNPKIQKAYTEYQENIYKHDLA